MLYVKAYGVADKSRHTGAQPTTIFQAGSIRPFCNNQHYWQVYFDTNALIRDSFTAAGFAVPEQHYSVRTANVGNGMGAYSAQ